MGRNRKRVQIDKYDGRRFTTIPYDANGRRGYHKVHLLTKDDKVAHRRVTALDGIDDAGEAKRRIKYLANARTETEERARLAELLHQPRLMLAITLEEAQAELESIAEGFLEEDLDDEMVERWRRAGTPNTQRDVLLSVGVPGEFLSENPDIYASIRPRSRKINPEWVTQNPGKEHEAKGELLRRPAEIFIETTGSKERVLDCISCFETAQEIKGTTPRHRRAHTSVFRRFAESVGNKPLSQLSKQDFIKWEDHVKETKGTRSNKWVNDQLKPIGAVLRVARRRMEDGVFPDSWREWIEFGLEPVSSAPSNKQPMPVDVLSACLQEAEAWANTEIEVYWKSLPVTGKNKGLALANNKKQAIRRKRSGLQLVAILRLCCNVGADPIDMTRLRWEHLRLIGALPLFSLPRYKTTWMKGEPMPRLTPLLPSTVQAIMRWKEWKDQESVISGERANRTAADNVDFVFTNDAKRAFHSGSISKLFSRLRESVDGTEAWSLKHLRNVGGTLAKRQKRHPDERTTFLGHSEGGTNRFYEADVGEEYLVDLVNLIGEAYFSGEKVGLGT